MIARIASYDETIRHAVSESIEVQSKVLEQSIPLIVRLSQLLVDTFRAGGKVVLFGNGGSAADAQHVAAELVNRFQFDREALPAIALSTDTSILTAVGNDAAFDQVFARQVRALVQAGDVAVGISTSGNSPNVLHGLEVARDKGALTVGFTGRDGGKLKELVDLCFQVPSDSTPRIQEAHITVWHALCQVVEQELFGPWRGAVFLDRDGTINEEVGYLSRPAELRLIPGAAEAIGLLNEMGVPVVVITNQAGVGRRYFPEAKVAELHAELARQLMARGAHLDAIYYCPHHPDDGCSCRKPKPGMLEQAAEELQVDLSRSFVVGDKVSDLEAGRRAGCRTVLVLTGYGAEAEATLKGHAFQPDFIARDLLEAVRWVLAVGEQRGWA